MTGSWRKAGLPMLVAVLASFLAFGFANGAPTGLTDVFELDGDAITGAHPGLPDDWDRVYNGTSSAGLTVFENDPRGYSLFVQGTKDIYDIGTWHWADQNAPPKDEIEQAFAAVYGQYLFFGADRYSTNGTAYLGFWLLKGTITFNPDGTVTGAHQVGDILILADFVNGGGVAVVPQLYRWVGSGGSDGALDAIPVDETVAWAIVNPVDATSPWPYEGKDGPGVFSPFAFFEGGVDLNAIGITGCFTDYICETRSSAEVNAELKDFVHRKFPASPEITVNDAAFCEGGSAQLCAELTGGVPPFTFAWSTGSTDSCITVSTGGVYTVTVTGSNGCSGQGSGTVTVYPLPACSITGNDAVCQGASTQWCGPDVAGYTYVWNGPGVTNATTRCIDVSQAGTYTLQITDSNGCQSQCQKTLTVWPLPNCSITGNDGVCQGFSTQWCGPDVAGYTYVWNGPGVTNVTTRCIDVSQAGTYTLQITDANGCQNQCQKTLTVWTLPECSITGNDAVCQGASTQWCGPDVAGYSYSWSGPGDFSATTRCVDVSVAGMYTLQITDSNGCQSQCQKELTVWPLPECSITGGTDAVCSGYTTEWCGPDVAGYTYSWSGPSSFSATTRCVTIGVAGVYTLQITDANGCQSQCQRELTVNPNPICNATPADTTVCSGTDAIFSDNTSGGTPPYEYCWEKEPYGGGCLSTTSQLTITSASDTDAGTYRVIVTDDNGCKDTCFVALTVEPCGGYCTYTMGGWGSGCPESQADRMDSTQPGCIRDHFFTDVFGTAGVTIGDPAGVGAGSPTLFALHFTSAAAVEAFLPSGSKACVLTADATNPPTKSAGGVLAGQLLALTLNVEYSCAGVLADLGLDPTPMCYGGYVIPDSCGKFGGITVDSFLVIGNYALADSVEVLLPFDAELSDVNFTATCLNESFNDCTSPNDIDPDGLGMVPAIGDSPDESSKSTTDVFETPGIPTEFKVSPSYPNPFNPSVTIDYALPSDGRVTIAIYDAIGRKLVTLLDGHRPMGYHSVTWLGKDANGVEVASGVYFCRVQFGDEAAVQKMIMLK